MMQRSLSLLAGVVFVVQSALGQSLADREYGIGIASMPESWQYSSSTDTLTIRARPSRRSKPVATLSGGALTFPELRTTVRSFERTLEFSYEHGGFPILAYSPDSAWVLVTLDCHDTTNSQVGWILRKTPKLTVQSWLEILSQGHPCFFLRSSWMAFYRAPDRKHRVESSHLFYDSIGRYILYPKQIKGRWMQVELETPPVFCSTEEEVMQQYKVKPRRALLWIEFLDSRGRPRIFYYTRGC